MSQLRPFSPVRQFHLIALAVFTVGVASCQAVVPDEAPAPAATQAREVVITSDTIANLAPGQKLVVDRSGDTAYTFDFAAAPIDFSRVAMRLPGGHEVAMDTWLNSSAYGKKLLDSPNRVFRLAAEKQSLKSLPSLERRNPKLIDQLVQNVWVCDVTITVVEYEILICVDDVCYYEYGQVIEVEVVCYDDGSEP